MSRRRHLSVLLGLVLLTGCPDEPVADDDDDNDADADCDGLSLCGGDCVDTDPELTHHGDRATLHVPEDHESIQGAIDASEDCDLILVGPGTYEESVVFGGKAIHLLAVEGPENTVIEGGEIGVRFADGETVSVGAGAGLFMVDSHALFQQVSIRDNHACYGGGLPMIESAPDPVEASTWGEGPSWRPRTRSSRGTSRPGVAR